MDFDSVLNSTVSVFVAFMVDVVLGIVVDDDIIVVLLVDFPVVVVVCLSVQVCPV